MVDADESTEWLVDSIQKLLTSSCWDFKRPDSIDKLAERCRICCRRFRVLARRPPDANGKVRGVEEVSRRLKEFDATTPGGAVRAWSAIDGWLTDELSDALLDLLERCGLFTDTRPADDICLSLRVLKRLMRIPQFAPGAAELKCAFDSSDRLANLVWLRMTHDGRLAAARDGHVLQHAANSVCPRTFVAIWHFFAKTGMPLDMIAFSDNGYTCGLASMASGLVHDPNAWHAITNNFCPYSARLVAETRNAAYARGREWISPLAVVSYTATASNVQFEDGFIWWASRVSVYDLNKYDQYGMTPLMHAARRGSEAAVDALLGRVDELDLLLPASQNYSSVSCPADAAGFAAIPMSTTVAADLMAWALSRSDAGKRLKLATDARRAARPVGAELAKTLLGDALPPELVDLCCLYADLPAPLRAKFTAPASEPPAKRQRMSR